MKNLTAYLVFSFALLLILLGFLYSRLYPRTYEHFHREGLGNRLVMYKVDWCPHCRRARPAFEALIKEMENRKDVELMIVDCEEHQDRCTKADIKAYPTILLEKEDGTNTQCRSALTRRGIESFLADHL